MKSNGERGYPREHFNFVVATIFPMLFRGHSLVVEKVSDHGHIMAFPVGPEGVPSRVTVDYRVELKSGDDGYLAPVATLYISQGILSIPNDRP